MRILHDYFLVGIEQLYDKHVTESGIITLNEAWIDPEEGGRYKYKRTYGTVLACPESFTDTVVSVEEVGNPRPKVFVGSDYIESMERQGYRGFGNKLYNCSSFDGFDKITLADIGMNLDVKKGDRIYFDERATEPERLRNDNYNGMLVYAIRADELICSIRKGFVISGGYNIIMHNKWVLIEPETETWEEIKTPSGIFVKPAPDVKYLQGFIRHIGDHPEMKHNDHIIYENNADAVMVVEDVDYYYMPQEDILARIN